jgi:hypothetical protein
MRHLLEERHGQSLVLHDVGMTDSVTHPVELKDEKFLLVPTNSQKGQASTVISS